MQATLYHSFLRIAVLTLAIVLLFDSGLLAPITKQLSANTQLYLGQAIGMSASIESTELSEITAALTQQEQELQAREAALRSREIQVSLEDTGVVAGMTTSTLILSILVSILLILIMINYFLDFTRARNNKLRPV